MKNAIMDQKVAEDILSELMEYYEVEKEEISSYQKLLVMIQTGRLEVCENKELKYKLFKSIKQNNGEELSVITLTCPTGQDLVDANKNSKGEMDSGFAIVANSANIALGMVYKMSIKDIKNCDGALQLFS